MADRPPEGKRALKQSLAMCMLMGNHTHWTSDMRTNIDIDDKLIAAAMKVTGATTKKQAVEEALKFIVDVKERNRRISEAYGKYRWEGDLDAMRRAE
jgi:Arc/MetJ family transcription regulator